MPIKAPLKYFILKRDIFYITILLAIASFIGVYLIITAPVIARDGVTFIEYTQEIETSPTETIMQEDQHPGYPVLILLAKKITEFIIRYDSLSIWIYSAQAVTLLFRLLAVVVLYIIGKALVGARAASMAILILILLPKPAEYGSDTLSDWPHLFFLATGMLLLIRGASEGKWWMFGMAGLAGGLGYLVRPECTQVIVYGVLWLALQLFWSKRTLKRPKAALAMILLLACFVITAGPYMKLKGALFPKKGLGVLSSEMQTGGVLKTQAVSEPADFASFIPVDIAAVVKELFQNIGESLMWFFLLPLLIGLYALFKQRQYLRPKEFFIAALIALYIPLMIWLYCRHGYMSARHSLPLVVFTIFYIPSGIQVFAQWLSEKFSKEQKQTELWSVVLFITGVAICVPKLLRPIHYDKLIYRNAAQWLTDNTEKDALIAVQDLRISFYAGRKGIEYDGQTISDEVGYVVCEPDAVKTVSEIVPLIHLEDKDNGRELQIYRIMP